ncbi:MAG: hypothetical protein H6Q73_9 [Firmicutes bacterium]|nr:hypothetical protein [Bacillota bacterium]
MYKSFGFIDNSELVLHLSNFRRTVSVADNPLAKEAALMRVNKAC